MVKQKLITCASFYGSGSSAVTDLISEYKDVKSMTDYEFRFIHDIDGVADLEYHLVDCHNRHNSGHALKRYRRLCEFNHGTGHIQRYEPYFQGKFLDISMDYINELTDFEFNGHWFMDMYDRGRLFYYLKSLQGKIYKIMGIRSSIMHNEMTLCSHPSREKFLECTKRYIERLLEAANKEKLPILMMDQILPSSNINKCLRYFPEDTRVVVVTRDPRDVFFSEKYVWQAGVIPHDVELFCKWFEYTHVSNRDENPDPQKVLLINFEDLVYDYYICKKKIELFLGFESTDHVNSFAKFNPKHSYVNTQLWNKFKDTESLAFIEKRLQKFLYDFNAVKNNEIVGLDKKSMNMF